MSQIIASDAPLLSTADNAPWEQHDSLRSPATSNGFGFNYYNLPPSPPHSIGSDSTDSPIPTSRMLKMRMSPDSCSDGEPQLCLPTHQVFDFPELSNPPSPSSGFSPPPSSPKPHRLSISINPGGKSGPGSKRAASPAPGVTKKQRSSGERISSKDFIPPDVSGLSKREARLVKNRAAAFLSRQRKREEFECMEVRVAELEQENARLLALSQNRSGSSRPKDESGDTLVSEIDKLRAQLAEAEKREQELSAELAEKASRDPPVKVEAVEPQVSITPARPASSIQSLHKSGASLGLMVLLCALPTLLSLPTHTAMPSTFVSRSTVARAASSSTFDFNPFMPNEQGWSRSNSMMDLDIDDHISSASTTTNTRKLEFVNGDSRLSSLDISFDTVSSENGKIRVRIHPSSSSGSSSPSSSFSTTLESSSLPMWSETDSDLLGSYGALSSKIGSTNDFLGVGSTSDFALDSDFMRDSSLSLFGQEMTSANFLPVGASDGFESDFCDVSGGGTRRVRIALKSMPSSGGEGGEWEVQLC